MIRVGYIAGEPTPGRIALLELIARRPELELTVVYAAATIQRREWSLDIGDAPLVLRGPRLPAMRVLHHDYPLTPQIWPLLRRERFDVLVIAGWSLMATQLAIVWARLHKVPYLLISENHFREARPRWVRALKRLVLPHIVKPAAGHLVTGTLAAEHQYRYGARPGSTVVFANTVDVDQLGRRVDELREQRDTLRQKLGIPKHAIVATQVSRLIPMKGPDEAVAAVARARRLTGIDLRLVLVGSGPMRDELERSSRALDLPVVFTGFLDADGVLAAYAASDVFLLFSRREPWGNVVSEAAAVGLPLVLADCVGAAADLLVPGENGELVRSGQTDEQAAAIARLASDQALRERFGRASRELMATWSYEPNVERFVIAVQRAAGLSA